MTLAAIPLRNATSPDLNRRTRVAVVGMGAIGTTLTRRLSAGAVPGIELAAVTSGDLDKARATVARESLRAPVLDLPALVDVADVVIECAPASAFPAIAASVLKAGKKLMVLSVGALLDHMDMVDLARRTGGQIIVPSGALLGLDAVSAAAEGKISSVKMTTRKPVKGLVGAPYLAEKGIRIEDITAPLKLFEGTAREAAKGFPANLNVAVALALAGVGPDETRLEIWADPALTRNTHRIVVESDSARIDMTIENIPSENPKTGRITAQSVLAALRKLNTPLRIGA